MKVSHIMDSYEVSLKKDIVPAILERLGRRVDPRKLFTLSVDALDLVFGYLFQEGNVAPSDIIDILNSTDNNDVIFNKLQAAAAHVSVLPEAYDEQEDIIAGIMNGVIADYVGIDMKNEIDKRLRDEKDINKLIEYSQMNLDNLQIALGIRPPLYNPSGSQENVRAAPAMRVIYPDTPENNHLAITAEDAPPREEVPFTAIDPASGDSPPRRIDTTGARNEASEVLKRRKQEAQKYVKIIRKKMDKNKMSRIQAIPLRITATFRLILSFQVIANFVLSF